MTDSTKRGLSVSRTLQLAVKRLLDVIISALVLALLAPVAAVIALLIRSTLGRPVLFRQRRLGLRSRSFEILKFRTMTDARSQDGELLPDEERLTRLGRFLRNTTLDEYPELFNVLKGEMSLIGPRALLADYEDLYTPEQMRRHDMRPGMGGPVLAWGRNDLSWAEKLKLDVWFVDNWSLALDLKILALTARAVLSREGVSAPGHATAPKFAGTTEHDPLNQ